MNEWFKRLFHHHEWSIIKEGRITEDGVYVGQYYIQKCNVCGKIRTKDV